MTYISMREYDKEPVIIRFSTLDQMHHFQHALIETNAIWKNKLGLSKNPFIGELNLNENTIQLYTKEVTGFINIGGISFEIKPKFMDSQYSNQSWKVALSNLLLLQSNPIQYKSNLIQSESVTFSLPDLLAERYISELEKALLLGLPKGYVFKEDSSIYFRGTYNTNKALEHLIKPQYIPCKFDDYVEDILSNQIIKIAAIKLSEMVSDIGLSIRLMDLSHQVDANLIKPSIFEIERAAVPMQYDYLNPTLELSKLILLNNSLIFNEGNKSNFGFLWNTSVVFENFVKFLVTAICNNRNYKFTDRSMKLYSLANGEINLSRKGGNTSPDIRIFDKAKIRWLLDAKYKNWNNGPKIQDIYQIITGALLSKINKASLVYPKGINTPNEQVFYNLNTINTPMFISCIFIDILKLSNKNGLNEIIEDLERDLFSE